MSYTQHSYTQHPSLPHFQSLLDPSRHSEHHEVDLAQLRSLCSNGIPQHPSHLRPLAYSLLLGVLPLDKREWKHVAKTQRAHYYGLVRTHMEHIEDLPETPGPIDKLLDVITRDALLAQSRFAFLAYALPSSTAPLAPTRRRDAENAEDLFDDDFSSSSSDADAEQVARRNTPRASRPLQISCRRAMFERIDTLQNASTELPNADVLSPQITLSSELTPQLSLSVPDADTAPAKTSITLLPHRKISSRPTVRSESHAEAVCRMVYIFVQANPQWVYRQGLVDLAANLYLVFSEIQWKTRTRRGVRGRVPVPRGKYAEERAYWAFCALVREYEAALIGTDNHRVTQILDCFSRRAEWSDGPLWSNLTANDIAPSAYASRWFSLLLVGAVPPSFLLPAWDFIISSRSTPAEEADALDALIDICVAVLLISRPILLGEARARSKGLWTESTDPTSHDAQKQLKLLRALPLEKVNDPESLLYIANRLKDERQGAAGLGLNDVPRSSIWTDPRALMTTSALASITQSSAQWTSSAFASVSGTLSGLATSQPTENIWSSWRSWSRPTPQRNESAVPDKHIVNTTLQSPMTPPRSTGPRPLLLSTRRVSVTPRGRDSIPSGVATPPAGSNSPPASYGNDTTSLYRIGSRQMSGRGRASES